MDWMKKHKILIICALVFVVIGLPVVIHCLFKIHPAEQYRFFVAEWTAGELLQYYGGLFSLIGTLVLGGLTLHQNYIIKQEADKRADSQEKFEHERNMPRFMVSRDFSGGNCSRLHIQIYNISENIASDVCVNKVSTTYKSGEDWKCKKPFDYNMLEPYGKIDLEIDNPEFQVDTGKVEFYLECNDKYGERHKYFIKGLVDVISNKIYFDVNELL